MRRARRRGRARRGRRTRRRGRRRSRAAVRIYSGKVESLSDAGAAGRGARLCRGRSGYAYGTDLDRLRRADRRGRRGGRRGSRVPTSTRACPEECGARPSRASRPRRSASGRTERKVELALAIERARARAGSDARSRTPSTPTPRAASRWPTRSGFAGLDRPGLGVRVGLCRRGRRPDDRARVGLGRDPGLSTRRRSAPRRPTRALALVGARQPESRRCPVVLDAFVAASFIGFIGSMLSADAVQRGRSLSRAARARRSRLPRSPWPTTPPTPSGPVERPLRRRGLADAGAPRSSKAAGSRLPLRQPHARARRAGRPSNADRGSYRTPPRWERRT